MNEDMTTLIKQVRLLIEETAHYPSALECYGISGDDWVKDTEPVLERLEKLEFDL